MIENCIGKMSLPLGLGLNFKINNKEFAVPMSIEEPSVIAAASGAAKLIKDLGNGFKAWSTDPIMTGQIQLLDVEPLQAQTLIEANKQHILSSLLTNFRTRQLLLHKHDQERWRHCGPAHQDCHLPPQPG